MDYVRYACLLSRSDNSVKDQLGFLTQRLNGWFEPNLFDVEYYVPAQYAYLLYCIDPHLEPLPQRDYIV